MKIFYWFKKILKNLKKPEQRVYNGEGEEEWSADLSQLVFRYKFASGRHSDVFRGTYKQTDVAIKVMDQSEEEDESLPSVVENLFNSEVKLLFRLRHPNIVPFVAACKQPPEYYIITEYMAEGSLKQYLHRQQPHSVPPDMVLKMALDIARGMHYLHSQGIVHRDLKSENLLLGEDMCVKVADFGISCLESECRSGMGIKGTYRWMAPEMIEEKHHTKKVDVYSFGIVMWELLTALTPFHDMTPEQAANAVSKKNARPTLPTACPAAFRCLIDRCWSSRPNKRPHFDEIISILESYAEAYELDADAFLSSYKSNPRWAFLGCVPRCNPGHSP